MSDWRSQVVGPLPLTPDRVDIWRRSLRASEGELAACRAVLSDAEHERAARFVVEPPRRQFILVRGTLRRLLGRYLDRSPEEITLDYGERGKPSLAKGGLQFNVSHSGELALLAFSSEREIGVDLERVREGVATAEIASRFFAPREVERLFSLPPELRSGAFFECWTRKEAYIKAIGDGLFRALDRFEVDFGPDREPRLLSVLDAPADVTRFSLVDLAPGPGYRGALMVEGAVPDLELQDVVG